MWGAEHLHGDETSWGGLMLENTYSCCGCNGGDYPESTMGQSSSLQEVSVIRTEGERFWDVKIGHYCPSCRENMTCTRCKEYDETVDRSKGKSVCESCLEQ